MIETYYDKNIFENLKATFRTIIIDSIEYFIYIPLNKNLYCKTEPDIFWHMASLGKDDVEEKKKENDDMLECANTIHQLSCNFNCKEKREVLVDSRATCIFRASTISCLPKLIEMYKANDGLVKCWKHENRIYIRSYIDDYDYVAIFKPLTGIYEGKKKLLLITAFPVVLYSYKKKFQKQYSDYCDK